MLNSREQFLKWRPFAKLWESYRNTPLLEEEKVLKNIWSRVKKQMKRKNFSKEDLLEVLTAFQNINEPGRLCTKTVFEDFFETFKKINHKKLCENHVNLICQTAEVYLEFSKPWEALQYFEDAIEIAIQTKHCRLLNLENYIKLMAQKRRFGDCTLSLTKLSFISQDYDYYRALAFIEAKSYKTAETILSKCHENSEINLLKTRLYFELKDWNKMSQPMNEVLKKELDEKYQWDKDNDKDFNAHLTSVYWTGKQDFQQKKYKSALDSFMGLTMLASKNPSRVYELKGLILNLMPEMIEMVDHVLQSEDKERYKLDEKLREEIYQWMHKIAGAGYYALNEEKYLKAIMLETLSKLFAIMVFNAPSQNVLYVLQNKTIFEAYAITENRDFALREIQEFGKKLHQGQEDEDIGHMYMYAHLYYANNFYYPEAIEAYEQILKAEEVKTDPYVFAIYAYTQGRILFEDQQHEKSIAIFKQCSKIKYEHGEMYLWRPALSYLYLKKYENAMKAFKYFWDRRTSRQFNGAEVTMAFLGQGYCATKLKRQDEAEKNFKRAELTKSGEDIPSVPFFRMIAAYDRGSKKETLKYLKIVMKRIKSVEKLVPFLQDKIVHDAMYLKHDWRNVLDVVSDHSRSVFANPKDDVHQFKTYRNSSLIVLCLLNKKYDS